MRIPDPSSRGFAARLQSPVWVVSLALVVAALGAAVAIAIAGTPRSNTGTTFVAPTVPAPATTDAAPVTVTSAPITTAPVTTAPVTTAPVTTAPATAPATTAAAITTTSTSSSNQWPTGTHGWTVVLGSYPASSGIKAAQLVAARAREAGLSDTGVLVSDAFSSLRPGYFVAYAGVYATSAAAASAVAAAQTAGFASAYSREITPA